MLWGKHLSGRRKTLCDGLEPDEQGAELSLHLQQRCCDDGGSVCSRGGAAAAAICTSPLDMPVYQAAETVDSGSSWSPTYTSSYVVRLVEHTSYGRHLRF